MTCTNCVLDHSDKNCPILTEIDLVVVLIVTEPGFKSGGGTKGPDNSSRKLLGLTILYSGR